MYEKTSLPETGNKEPIIGSKSRKPYQNISNGHDNKNRVEYGNKINSLP
jgi:hypothetical protein